MVPDPLPRVDNDVSGDLGVAVQAGVIAGDVRIGSARVPPAIPRQLPAGSGVFTGRADLLVGLDRTLLLGGLAIVTGMAGVGKTALVVRWAQGSTKAFPDGQLYIDLRGFGTDEPVPPHVALAGFLRALGQSRPEAMATLDERAACYRTLMSGRRALVILDNASSVDQVRPLLPGTNTCSVVVISRLHLSGLVGHHGAAHLRVEPMRESEGVALLRSAVGGGTDEDSIARLARLCAGLPLAMRIAAERLVDVPLASARELEDELADEGKRLDVLDSGDDARSAVRTVFSWSYRGLTEDEARLFQVLGLHPDGAFSVHAAAALFGGPLDVAARTLRSLVGRCLVTRPEPGRFEMHDLLRAYAREQVVLDSATAVVRLFDHYLHTADHAGRIVMPHRFRFTLEGTPVAVPELPGRQQALRWFDVERRNLEAMCALDKPALDARRWQLAYTLRDYYFLNKSLDGWRETHLAALAACLRSGDVLAEARTRNNLGMVLVEAGDLDEAMRHYELAQRLFEQLGDEHGRSNALANQAVVLRRRKEFAAALRNQQQALKWYVHSGAHRNVGITLRGMALVAMELGDLTQAVQYAEGALNIAVELGLDVEAAEALNRLGRVHQRAGDHALAQDAFRQALEYARRGDTKHEEAHALHQLGILAAAAGRTDEARQLLSAARDRYQALGSSAVSSVTEDLAALPAFGD